MSYPDCADYREATRDVFADTFAFRPAPLSLGSGWRAAAHPRTPGHGILLAYAPGALLFGVQIADVAAFALTCGGLASVAIIASWLPARRAARLDPVFALRTE